MVELIAFVLMLAGFVGLCLALNWAIGTAPKGGDDGE